VTTAPAEAARPVRRVGHVMGLPVSLAVRGRHADDDAGRRAWQDVLDSLVRADHVFSTYRPDSWLSRLDRGEVDLVDCPPEVAEVLALGDAASDASGGAFGVSLPRPDGGLRLDPSGVVKGWALERAAEALRALPGTDFCLSGGGDLLCRTLDPSAAPWHIGIEDPHHPRHLLAQVPVTTGAVATSGTAHRGAHLVDARTGAAPAAVAQVTVVAASLTQADVDATSAFALGPEAASWLSTRPSTTGLVVWADGTTTPVPDTTRSRR